MDRMLITQQARQNPGSAPLKETTHTHKHTHAATAFFFFASLFIARLHLQLFFSPSLAQQEEKEERTVE